MLWTLAVLLTVLWALGLVTAHSMGGFIHILVILAVVAVHRPHRSGTEGPMKKLVAGALLLALSGAPAIAQAGTNPAPPTAVGEAAQPTAVATRAGQRASSERHERLRHARGGHARAR